MTFGITGLVFAVSVIGLRYFDVAPVAREMLLDIMEGGVLVLNESNQVLDINPAARELLGVDSSCVGEPADLLLSPWPELLSESRRRRSHFVELQLSEHPLRVIDAQLTPIIEKDPTHQGLLILMHDITARVLAERKLQEAHDQLQAHVAEISRLQEAVREQSIHDVITGLFNRRYLEETLPRELAGTRRRGASLAVILLDVDHFKTVNDTFGHQEGDRTLQRLAALLDSSTREGDIACRYGGDEFVLVLPDTTLTEALDKAEVLRKACSSLDQEGFPHITISLGIACSPDHGEEGGQILLIADRALYRAKEDGRNQAHTG